ncbi:MAG: 2-C-methyl-D-erythritol 4-phosphate cytidylyltransferase [Clostridiales bacterium]|nr:2-C-methyl-D-erythritol 4-phosphate cytidylyltransferase [Clostridiales bacterium]
MEKFFSWLKGKAKQERPYCAAVVPAAGSARRMEGVDKILAELGGVPVIVRTLGALNDCDLIDEIIVVTREDLIVPISGLVKQHGLNKVKTVVKGGDTRAESVRLGLAEVSKEVDLAAIHDGARPFVTRELLEEVIHAAERTNAAAPAVPVVDTIKVAHNGLVDSTPDRETLFAVQTPQVFEYGLITGALERALRDKTPLTDDCSAVEAMGMKVTLTTGSRENIKITTPIDLATGEAILQWLEQD